MSSRFWRPEIYLARVVLPFVACNRCRKTQSAYLRGIIKSAREEWPRNPPGNGKMAITSFYVTRILDHSRPQRFTRFSTPPIFATRFPPFAFNSFSRLRMHKQKRSLTIQQIVDDYTPIDLTYWVCDACLNYTLQKVFFTLILLPRRSMV